MKKIAVTFYTREACVLCKEAYYLLMYVAEQFPLDVQTIQITDDPELEERFALEIPVIEVEGTIVAAGLIEETTLREYFETRVGEHSKA